MSVELKLDLLALLDLYLIQKAGVNYRIAKDGFLKP
jgi:hypothetical protein